jgi:hypothetical protein
MVVMGQCCEQPHGATTADDNPASARNFRRVEVGEVGRFAHTAGDLELKQGCPCDGSGSELNHDALLGSLGECRALPAGLEIVVVLAGTPKSPRPRRGRGKVKEI